MKFNKILIYNIFLFFVLAFIYSSILTVGENKNEQLEPDWIKLGSPYFGEANKVFIKSDAVYVVGGRSILKYDTNANLIWANDIGMDGNSVFVTNDSVYIVGENDLPKGYDAFLIKYDIDGNYQWEKIWGSNNVESAKELFVYENYIYVMGVVWNEGYQNDVFILKYNNNGNLLWEKTWGWNFENCPYSMYFDGNSFYIAGQTMDSYDYIFTLSSYWKQNLNSGSVDYELRTEFKKFNYTIDIDTNIEKCSNKSWRTFDEPYSYRFEDNGSIVNVYKDTYHNAFLAKFDMSGNEQWSRIWGTSSYDGAYAVSGNSEEIYITGETTFFSTSEIPRNEDTFLAKYDTDGNLIWNRTWGGKDRDVGIALSVNKNNITICCLQSRSCRAIPYLLRYDSEGNLIWEKKFDYSDMTKIRSIFIDDHDIYLGGSYDHLDGCELEYGNGFLIKYNDSTEYSLFNKPIAHIWVESFEGYTDKNFHVHAKQSQSENPLKIKWEWGDNSSSISKSTDLYFWNNSHIYSDPGDYTITLTIFDENGENGTYFVKIKILPNNEESKIEDSKNNESKLLLMSFENCLIIALSLFLFVLIILLLYKNKKSKKEKS
jgi:hypothetical protein